MRPIIEETSSQTSHDRQGMAQIWDPGAANSECEAPGFQIARFADQSLSALEQTGVWNDEEEARL
ncbi:MAG: hypothetical protein AAGC95_17320 [Pseudomonadota bacterium]